MGLLLKNKRLGFLILQKVSCNGGEAIGKPLKCLCMDNGDEYTSHEFKIIVLSMASYMRKQYLTLHNIMVWPKEPIELLLKKSEVHLKGLNCLSHLG